VQELASQPPPLRGSATCVCSRFGRGSSGAGSPKEQPAYQRVSSQHGEARQRGKSLSEKQFRNDNVNSERDPQRNHLSVYPSTLRHRDGVGSRTGATRTTRKASSSNVRSTPVAIGRHPRCTLGRLAVMLSETPHHLLETVICCFD
jgi:hypothetical protein